MLNELNINMANQIPSVQNGAVAGRVANPGQGQQAQPLSTADADLEARLDALRRN